MSESRGPLAGIRVIDLGHFVAGPVTATLLGEFGADVIKVERRGAGDGLRRLGWLKDGESLWWSVEARNKRSITLDISQPAGLDLLLRLIDTADVLVENLRPGALARRGLTREALEERNPRLIFLQTSGYGQTGPYAGLPAFNTAVESLGGLRYLVGEPDRPPARPGIAFGDYAGALFGTIGVLLALYERDGAGSGRGQGVDNALYEAVMRLTEYTISGFDQLGRVRERVGGGSVGTVPARSYRCADGLWVGISAASDAMYVRLCETIGRPELIDDPRLCTNSVRIENRELIDGAIEAWAAERAARDAVAELRAAAVSVSLVHTAATLVEDEHVRAREAVIAVDDQRFGPLRMQGVVPRLTRTPGGVRRSAPAQGEHNREIYCGELGLDEAEFERLEADGVI